MTNTPKIQNPRSYSSDELNEFAEFLSPPPMPGWFIERMQRALLLLQFYLETVPAPKDTPQEKKIFLSVSEQRKAMTNIEAQAKALRKLLSDDRLILIGGSKWKQSVDKLNLDSLITETRAVIDSLPSKGGRPENFARRIFLEELAQIYFEIKGKPPRRSHHPAGISKKGIENTEGKGKDTGEFLEFARVALRHYPHQQGSGLEGAVRKICENFKPRAPTNAGGSMNRS